MRRSLIPLGLLLASASLLQAQEPALIELDENLLRAAEVRVDGPGLLNYLRNRTLRDTDRARVEALIRLLADDQFDKREQATADLIQIGAIAVGPLREAVKVADLEVARRAERCLEAIEQRADPACVAAAIRLLGVRRPEGSVETLLDFVPNLSDPNDIDEAGRILGRLAVREGTADPLLVRALTFPDAARRAVAGEVLARAGLAGKIPQVRKLLADRDLTVRSRIGLALLEAQDRDAIPVLIDLLAATSPEQARLIEETLYSLAGEKSPTDVPGFTEADRQLRVKNWLAWWKEHGAELKLDRLDFQNRHLGYTLLVQFGTTNGIVRELDRAGKTRWQIESLAYPLDAQVLPGDRVLVCEYRGKMVTERNLKGQVLWRYDTGTFPISARRLPGGNTFVVTRSGLVEVDRQAKEVWRYNSPSVAAAARLRDGTSILVDFSGRVLRINREGKEVKTFQAGGPVLTIGASVDVTPEGRILIPLYNQNKVVEFDANGKQIWQAEVRLPGSVFRLPSGNVLVTSRLANGAQELDRTGKVVGTQQAEVRLMRATRR